VADASYSIFLSCGAPYTMEQERFIADVENILRSHGCTPSTIGRNSFSIRQPVEAARDLIGTCDGAIVVAFERFRIINAIEKPGADKTIRIGDKYHEESKIRLERHPTVWNQMEAAMAYAQGVPIFSLVETNLKRQGMLSDRLEWTALLTDLSENSLKTDEFQQTFAAWLQRVAKHRDEANRIDGGSAELSADPGQFTIRQLITMLKPGQLWQVFSAVGGVAIFIAGAAFAVGRWFAVH